MATFLTTSKMSPELRDRVERAVRGGRSASARLRPRSIMILRVVVLTSMVVALGFATWSKRSADQEVEQLRAGLLTSWQEETRGLEPRQRALHQRAGLWLTRAAQKYPGDFIADELSGVDALEEALKRPMIYVRGSLEEFSSSAGVEACARESVKDSFVLCLKEPPRERTETAVLRRVRAAYASGSLMREATANVQRLGDAWLAAPVLDDAFAEQVRSADSKVSLLNLKRTLESAPTRAARLAAKAELLLYLIDEPGRASAVTELDGERPHDVRVGLVDLASSKPILRLRRPVDPSWLSDVARVEFARGADSCVLALDVREALTKS